MSEMLQFVKKNQFLFFVQKLSIDSKLYSGKVKVHMAVLSSMTSYINGYVL